MKYHNTMTHLVKWYRQSINPPYTQKDYVTFGVTLLVLIALPFAILATQHNQTINQYAASNKATPTPLISGISIQSDSFIFHPNEVTPRDCTGEDDFHDWIGAGSLAPGQTYTYTPQYPDCYNNDRFASVNLSWSGSQLQMSTVNPGYDSTYDTTQQGKTIVAPVIHNTSLLSSAALCILETYTTTVYPLPTTSDWYSEGAIPPYTITIKNTGTTTANNIKMVGRDFMSWTNELYSQCMNADADHNGWNDTLKRVVQSGGSGSGFMDYLTPLSWIQSGNSLMRANPADFNGDNIVDQTDVASVSAYVGQGNGSTAYRFSATTTPPANFPGVGGTWRIYDINGDGYVDQTDVNIVSSLVGKPYQLQQDSIAPWVKITNDINYPPASVKGGSNVEIGADAWDNEAVARVEFYVNGSLLAIATQPNDMRYQSYTYPIPLFEVTWKAPRKTGSYTITAKVYDAAGNFGTAAPYTVTVQ